MPYHSKYRFARISARKARLVTDMIKGRGVADAQAVLSVAKQRAAVMVRKTLDAAIASADQGEADVRSLIVTEARVDEGPNLPMRFHPKDRGRAHPIRKRTSHIIVAVDVPTDAEPQEQPADVSVPEAQDESTPETADESSAEEEQS